VTTALALPPLVPQVRALLQAAKTSEEHRQKLETANQELQALYQRVKELDRAKTEFFANVSHELRTPLTLILGPTEKLLSSSHLEDSDRHNLQVVDRNARALLYQVNVLLELSRLEFGRIELDYRQVDLAQLVRLTTVHFETLAQDRQIQFSVETPASLPAQIDPEKLQQVLLNLLSNAFKFTPDGGEIVCCVQANSCEDGLEGEPASQAGFVIQDSGPGILPELRDVVFERFYSKSAGNSSPFGGIGLGLAIAKELIELHQGSISVTDAPAGGACFRIVLPLIAPHNREVKPSPNTYTTEALVRSVLEELRNQKSPSQDVVPETPPVPALGESAAQESEKPLVLVVEDSPEMNWFIAQVLAEQYRVVSAFDGQEGLIQAIALHPDLILSDVMMPNLDGEQLVQQLRQHPDLAGIPVILLTARTDRELKVSLLRHGAQDYLTKPFSTAELQARVENLITLHRARRVLQSELASQSQDIAALATELSQRKQELEAAAEELRRNNRMKDEFLATLSHELRTPLNPILGWTKLLQTRQFDPETSRRALETIERNARLQTQLVNDLLEVSRIIQGKIRLQARRVDLATVLESALEAVRLAAEAKAIDLRLQIGNEQEQLSGANPKFPLLGDPDRLQQVIWNLISNATKFTPEGGKVIVQLQRVIGHRSSVRGNGSSPIGHASLVMGEEPKHLPQPPIPNPQPPTPIPHYAQITVTDTGIGIHPDFLPHVFDRFRQGDSSLSRSHGGLGLGLAIVRHLVELHGGSVRAESAGEGQGATFTVLLPLIEEVNPEEEEEEFELPSSEQFLPLAGLQVLVIDDDADSRDYLSAALRAYGMGVRVATTAREGIEIITQAQHGNSLPDILVSDIGLPDQNGYALLHQVRKLDSQKVQQIPAIALTARASEKDADQARLAGFQLHLPKPVEPKQLAAAIASLTKGQRRRTQDVQN
jgi:signal transduction histidine kinase